VLKKTKSGTIGAESGVNEIRRESRENKHKARPIDKCTSEREPTPNDSGKLRLAGGDVKYRNRSIPYFAL